MPLLSNPEKQGVLGRLRSTLPILPAVPQGIRYAVTL